MSEQDKERVAAAIEYIKSKITELVQSAKCEPIYDPSRMAYRFDVLLPKKNFPVAEIRFSRENMEDFSGDDTDCGIRLRYYIDFKIYIELIKSNLIPSFKISKIFIEEAINRRKSDWWSDRYVSVAFDNKITAVFTDGLKKLKEAVERTFKENVVDKRSLSELEEDLSRINGILDYYNAHKSLDETAASIKSLSILKAGAIYAIVEKEKRRDNNRPYLTNKINEEICSIAAFLHEGAFLEVRPPEWLGDYVSV